MSIETTTNTIIVTLMDNTRIPFNIEVIKESLTIKNIMEDIESDDDVPVYNESCNATIMLKIKDFLEYIYTHPSDKLSLQEFINTRGHTAISEWFIDFITVEQKMLFDLAIASDFLDIKILLDFVCWSIANNIKDLTPAEIQKTFSNSE
jgi:hypothetical protein